MQTSEGFLLKMNPNFERPFTAPYGLNLKNPFPTKVSLTHELSIQEKKFRKMCKGKAVKDFLRPQNRPGPP